MASKRHLREKACTGKIRYTTPEQAYSARRSTNRKHYTGPMNVYKCKFCGGYHIGHAPKFF